MSSGSAPNPGEPHNQPASYQPRGPPRVDRFARACSDGDLEALIAVLAPDAVGDFDSGGMIPDAPLTELEGAQEIAAQLIESVSGFGASFMVREVNGDPGVLITINDRVLAAVALGVRDGKIDLVHAVGNPAKLTHIQPDRSPSAAAAIDGWFARAQRAASKCRSHPCER